MGSYLGGYLRQLPPHTSEKLSVETKVVIKPVSGQLLRNLNPLLPWLVLSLQHLLKSIQFHKYPSRDCCKVLREGLWRRIKTNKPWLLFRAAHTSRNGANYTKRYLEYEPEATSIEGRKQENGSCRFSKTCVSSTASRHRICASLYVVFSQISICQSIISFLSRIYDFNGKSEEVTDNKTFPSEQHLLLTSHVGEL